MEEFSKIIKNFFREKINIAISLLVLNMFLILYAYVEILDSNYHYYMNTKTSLESIYNKNEKDTSKMIKFDKYDGQIEKPLSTEEQLIRKNNRKFHLYYLLKNLGL